MRSGSDNGGGSPSAFDEWFSALDASIAEESENYLTIEHYDLNELNRLDYACIDHDIAPPC